MSRCGVAGGCLAGLVALVLSCSHPVPIARYALGAEAQAAKSSGRLDLADGSYQCEVTLAGGSGRATIESPTTLVVEGGAATLRVVWSSPFYDYMVVEGRRYLPTNSQGNSTFEIPLTALDEPLEVTADTTAMSQPHEIDYVISVPSKSLKAEGAIAPGLPLACAVVAAGGAVVASRLRKGKGAAGG